MALGKPSRVEEMMSAVGVSVASDRIMTSEEKDKNTLLTVLEGRSKKKVREITLKDKSEVACALSPDGKTIAAASNKSVRLIDVATGAERIYEAETRKADRLVQPGTIKFSQDNQRIVVIGEKGRLHIHLVADGSLLRAIKVDGNESPSSCAFTADGKTLLTCGTFDGKACVFEVATGQMVRQYESASLLSSPDNRLLAVPDQDTLQIYRLYDGKPVFDCKAAPGLTGNWAFSPNSKMLATTHLDTTVLVWDSQARKSAVLRAVDDSALRRIWRNVEAEEAQAAYLAMGELIELADRAVSFLRANLRTIPEVEVETIRDLILEIDDNAFTKRETAERRLANLGVLAESAMRAELAREATSAEAKSRLSKLVSTLKEEREKLSPEERTHLRAIQVLEQIGTSDAKRLLQELARGAEGAPRTHDAREALRRLSNAP